MDKAVYKSASTLIPSIYLQQACEAKKSRENRIKILIEHKKWPRDSWDDSSIEQLVQEISNMDSNNFLHNCGVGEREARIACDLVAKRHYGFGHGIGRSGDISEAQPKAAGSSMMSALTNVMLKDVFKAMGCPVSSCLLLPVATGMSLVLCMISLRQSRPNAKYVIWSRIDQKSCFKSIITAGYTPIIVDMIECDGELKTDLDTIIANINDIRSENILCVMTTTSCFAPRSSDNVLGVAQICKSADIPHIVNNAYGLQSNTCMNRLHQASLTGRIDAFVQSTDKNLMVPVGGAIVASFDKDITKNISKIYPGRASSAPLLDVFMTLLSLGSAKYMTLVKARKVLFQYLKKRLSEFAILHQEKIFETKNNPISIAMTLSQVDPDKCTSVGSMLFLRGISGVRVIQNSGDIVTDICGYPFKNWGGHLSCPQSQVPYLTAAASLGATMDEVDSFVKKLDKVLYKINSCAESTSTLGN